MNAFYSSFTGIILRIFNQVRGLRGKVLPGVFRIVFLFDKNRRQYFSMQTEQTRLLGIYYMTLLYRNLF